MHFPLFHIFPPIFEKIFGLRRKFHLTFSETLFLVIDHEFRISPLFQFVSPYCGKFFFSPYFCKIPPDFVKLTCFYILYMYFVSPYFYHDVFMHHTMHVGYWTPLYTTLNNSNVSRQRRLAKIFLAYRMTKIIIIFWGGN